MKKLLIVIGVCMLLVGMQATMASSIPRMGILKREMPTVIEETISANNTPPDWAAGNFTGVWGIDIWGEVGIPLGWLAGYYTDVRLGFFYGGFAEFGEENATAYLSGIFFGPFMLGTVSEMIGENVSGNQSLFVGLGNYNETNFYWRIMGMKGPTYFMYGTYSMFEEE